MSFLASIGKALTGVGSSIGKFLSVPAAGNAAASVTNSLGGIGKFLSVPAAGNAAATAARGVPVGAFVKDVGSAVSNVAAGKGTSLANFIKNPPLLHSPMEAYAGTLKGSSLRTVGRNITSGIKNALQKPAVHPSRLASGAPRPANWGSDAAFMRRFGGGYDGGGVDPGDALEWLGRNRALRTVAEKPPGWGVKFGRLPPGWGAPVRR